MPVTDTDKHNSYPIQSSWSLHHDYLFPQNFS
jgi:hypothetical protein